MACPSAFPPSYEQNPHSCLRRPESGICSADVQSPCAPGTDPFRTRGRQRSNTLDFAGKIVCQRGASAPLWKLPAGFDRSPSAVNGPQSNPDQQGAARPLLKPPGQGDAVPPEPPAKEDFPPLDFLCLLSFSVILREFTASYQFDNLRYFVCFLQELTQPVCSQTGPFSLQKQLMCFMHMFFQLLFLSFIQRKKKPKYAPYQYKKDGILSWSGKMQKWTPLGFERPQIRIYTKK